MREYNHIRDDVSSVGLLGGDILGVELMPGIKEDGKPT